MHTYSTLSARIGSQRLSELRQLWPQFSDELCVSLFADRFPKYARTQLHSQPTPTSLGQRCISMFRCNLTPAFLAE